VREGVTGFFSASLVLVSDMNAEGRVATQQCMRLRLKPIMSAARGDNELF
jgi:hypothetical protein